MLDRVEMTAEQISNLLKNALTADISKSVTEYLLKLGTAEIEAAIKLKVESVVKSILTASTAITRDHSSGELVINIVFRTK